MRPDLLVASCAEAPAFLILILLLSDYEGIGIAKEVVSVIIVSLDNGIEYVTERFPSFKNVTGNAHSVDKSARTAERRGAR